MTTQTVLFAGGGTGGHIYPNVAIFERLRDKRADVSGHFVVSQRAVDARVVEEAALAMTALPITPLPKRPMGAIRFVKAYRQARRQMRALIERTQAKALVATGGFVSGPAARSARRAGLPMALVNLDATPGVANRLIARDATGLFSVYPSAKLASAERIGMPMRSAAAATRETHAAREQLGLDPARPTLLLTAGSQGAATLNAMGPVLWQQSAMRAVASRWQVLHLAGETNVATVAEAYDRAGVSATVLPYCHAMGLAWSAADVAISRAGAGSVGEVWANHVPTLFLPYPYHRDEHQRHNAQPLVDAGGALVRRDRIEPNANATQVSEALAPLLAEPARLATMQDKLRASAPPDGADVVANWLATVLAGA